MKGNGKSLIFSVFAIFLSILMATPAFAQMYWSPNQWNWANYQMLPNYLSNVVVYPQQYWNWPTQLPSYVLSNLYSSGITVIRGPCTTNITIPINQPNVAAGQRVFIQGRIYTTSIGFNIINPQAAFYLDGNLLGTAMGDWNGNYYFDFPTSPFIALGTHVITANATIQGCLPGWDSTNLNVNSGPSIPQYYPPSTSNVGSLIVSSTDCSNGSPVPTYVTLNNGAYGQIGPQGNVLFSNIPAGSYSYWISSPGYSSVTGSVTVSTGQTSNVGKCLYGSQPVQQPFAQTIVPGPAVIDPPASPLNEKVSHASAALPTPVAVMSSDVILVFALLAVLAVLIIAGIGINLFGRENSINAPEEM